METTYVENKIVSAGFDVTEIKDIQFGKQFKLANGGNVNVYTTGRFLVQGNGGWVKHLKQILQRAELKLHI